MQSGLARQYTVDEAFAVYLGGHLVAELKFTIPEARQILADLRPRIEQLNLFYNYKTLNSETATFSRNRRPIHIRIWRSPDAESTPIRFGYLLRRCLQIKRQVVAELFSVEEQTEEQRLDDPAFGLTAEDSPSWCTLNISVLHQRFMRQLRLTVD